MGRQSVSLFSFPFPFFFFSFLETGFNDRCSDFLFDRVEINAVDWRSFMGKRAVGNEEESRLWIKEEVAIYNGPSLLSVLLISNFDFVSLFAIVDKERCSLFDRYFNSEREKALNLFYLYIISNRLKLSLIIK